MSGLLRAVGTVASIVALIPSPIQPIAAAVAVAASVGAQLTAKRPTNERAGLQLQFKIDPGAPIPYVVGRTAVGGTVVHHETYGTDNHYNTYFAVLSGGGPCQQIENFLADRAVVSFSGTSALGYYAKWMWQDRQVGATPEADALGHGVVSPPFGSIPSTVPGWGAAYKLSGYAAASLTMLFDTKARRYANGEPLPGWIVRGPRIYDPRLDSTYPGGSGPCRIDQPATWVWSETPALHALKWRLGIFQNGKRIMGVGAPIDLIDVARIVEAANIQEANGWKIGGELNSEMDRWEALKLIEQAGGAEPIANGAMMSTLQKMPRVSIGRVETRDLVGDSYSIPGTRPRRERINGFRAQFRSEVHGWEMVPIDIVQVPQYVTEDGREVTGSGDYSLVQNADQAASLAAYEVFDSRELQPIELNVGPRFIGYRVGDCITVDVPELLLEEQDCIIRGRSIDPATGIVTLKLATETAGKHAAALGQTGTPPPTPTLHYDPLDVPAPSTDDWDALGGTVADGNFEIPALIISGAVANSAADGVVFDYRLTGGGDDDWVGASIESADTTRKVVTGVLPETSYDVGIRYKVAGIIGDRLVIGPCVTGIDSASELAEQALAAAEAAGELINGKATIFWRATPPTAAESVENDYWINTAEGNRPYIRIAGDGRISFGGTVVTFGGSAIVFPPWRPVEDQRAVDALTAAVAAQATADGKAKIFVMRTASEPVPVGEAVGDSLVRLYLSPPQIDSWDGSTWVPSATYGATSAQAASIAASEAAIAAISSDDILSKGEKPAFVREWWSAQTRYNAIVARAVNYDVAPAVANLTASYNALAAYVAGITPSYADTDHDSPINGATLLDLWDAFYDNYGALDALVGGATPAQLQQIADALTAAENAQATADGKIASFYQPTAPAVASEGDYWTDTDDNKKLYRWTGGAWVSVRDDGIPAAIAAAAGAQATADGKVTTFESESEPTAEAVGDLWYIPSSGIILRWNGSNWSNTADNTALNQVTVTLGQAVEVPADYQGTIAAGVLPRFNQIKVMRGDTDVTTANDTTYAIQNATGGCDGNVSIDNTNGSATKGRQQIGIGFNATGSYEVVVSYRGTQAAPPIKVTVTKTLGAPPTGGGSGTDGYSNNGSFSPTGRGVGSTTMFELGRIPAIAKAAGQTQANLTFNASYTVSGTANVVRHMIAKWQVSPAAANSWTDVTAAVDGSNATYNLASGDSSIGSISVPGTYAMGVGAYDFRVVASINATTGNASLFVESGGAAAVTS